MEPVLRTFDDLGGGLNEGGAPSGIGDNQFVLLDNFYPYDKRIVRRNGTFRKSITAYSSLLTGMLFFRTSGGALHAIFGTPTGFVRITSGDTGTFIVIPQVPIPEPGPDTFMTSDKPWVMVQMNGVGYAMREGAGKLLRVTNGGWSPAGFSPPAACTIAANGTGVMTAGDRTVRYTFRNSQTGEESNMSDVSNTITLNADESIDASGVAISGNPYVNQRRFYVNAPGTDGVWLYAGDIDNNTATTVNINKAVSQLGHIGSVRNGLPPDDLIVGDIFLDSYLVASDGVDVWISEAFRPASFYAFNRFDVFKNDGHRVRGIRAWGDRIVVGKTNKVHTFTKIGNVWNRETISDDHGIYSHHSMQVADGRLLFYGGDDIYYSDGGAAQGVGNLKIKKILARIPANRKEYVTGTVFPKLGWYLLSVTVDPAFLANPTDPDDPGTFPSPNPEPAGNNLMIGLNYRTGAWFTSTFDEDFGGGSAPMLIASGYGQDWEQGLFAIFYDKHYYQFNRGTKDGTAAIRARARSKAHAFSALGMLSVLRRLYFRFSKSVAAVATLRAYRDEDSTAVKERADVTLNDLDFDNPRDDKGFNMYAHEKGSLWQWEVDYSGDAPLEIEAAAMEVIPTRHRVRVR